MKKKIIRFSVLPIMAASVFMSFSTKNSEDSTDFSAFKYLVTHHNLCYHVPEAPEYSGAENGFRFYPELGNSYIAFKEALGFAESGGDYYAVNDFGYLGKYQFGRGTLEMVGIDNINLFLSAPNLQEAAFYANTARNKWILKRDIERFRNEVIDGINITESGILAAAHLAGPGNVKKFLRSWGANEFSDGFGTSIKYYFRKFSGYDTSFVKPERLAQAIAKS